MQENRLHFVNKINNGIWAIVWDPYTTSDINKLERIQRRAARFITGDYKTREEGSVTKMLNDLVREPSTEENKPKTGIPVQGG